MEVIHLLAKRWIPAHLQVLTKKQVLQGLEHQRGLQVMDLLSRMIHAPFVLAILVISVLLIHAFIAFVWYA